MAVHELGEVVHVCCFQPSTALCFAFSALAYTNALTMAVRAQFESSSEVLQHPGVFFVDRFIRLRITQCRYLQVHGRPGGQVSHASAPTS